MKNILFIFMVVIVGSIAFASGKTGSQCGLTDSKDESWKAVASRSLSKATDEQIRALPSLTKRQVIITAKWFAKEDGEDSAIHSAVDAVRYMESSDGLYVTHYEIRKNKYTEVLSYPGDNPVGLVFIQGTLHVVAENDDDTITCH